MRHLSIERGRQQIGCSYGHGATALLYTLRGTGGDFRILPLVIGGGDEQQLLFIVRVLRSPCVTLTDNAPVPARQCWGANLYDILTVRGNGTEVRKFIGCERWELFRNGTLNLPLCENPVELQGLAQRRATQPKRVSLSLESEPVAQFG